MLLLLESSSAVLVKTTQLTMQLANSKSVLICNRFHSKRIDSEKNNDLLSFRGYSFFKTPVRGDLLTQRHEKLQHAVSEDFVILD